MTRINVFLFVLVFSTGFAQARLVSHWTLDGTPNDAVGGFNGQEVAAVTYTNGVIGQAVSLAGAEYVELGSGVLPQQAYTKTAWIRRTGNSNNNILSGTAGAGNGHAFYCTNASGNNSRMASGHNGSWFAVRSDAPVPLDQWMHVAVSYDSHRDGGTLTLYTNGMVVAGGQGVATNVPTPGDTSAHIGAHNNASFFIGQIDDVGLFDHALPASEVQQMYVAGLGGTNLANLAYVLPLEAWVDYTACPAALQVVPRNPSNNMASVSIAGDVVTNGYEAVALRVYRDDIQTMASTQTLVYAVGRASFSFDSMIPAELANYDFEIVLRKSGAETIVRRVEDVVGGDVIVVQGQSNAVATGGGFANAFQGPFLRSFGRNSSQAEATSADTSWVMAEGEQNINAVQGSIGQWAMVMARKLIDETGIPLAVINGAHGGQAINFFQRNDATPLSLATNYGRLLTRMRAAGLDQSLRAILWYQGESDNRNAVGHVNGWTSLYNDWLEDYPSSEELVVIQIRDGCSANDKWYADLRNQQRLLADTLPRVSVMSTTGLNSHDGCHYAFVDGYEGLGERMHRLLAMDLYGSSTTNAVVAPNPDYAFYSSPGLDEITLVMRNPQDALIFDVGAEADFRVEGSAANVISGTAAGNEVVLTLDGDASDGAGLTYGGHTGGGAWVTNATGVGLLTFFDLPIALMLSPADQVTNLTATAVNSVRIDLRWNAATNAASYRVFRDSVEVGTTSELIFRDVDLQPNTPYTYAVESFNAFGPSSQAFVVAQTPAPPSNPPGVPTGLAGTPLSETKIGLSWDEATDATSYRVKRDGLEIAIVFTNAFTDTGLNAGVTYAYSLAAENPIGLSAFSAGVDVTTAKDDVFTRVAEAAAFEMLYRLPIPDGAVFLNGTPVPYDVDRSAQISGVVVRVAYDLELDTGSGPEWVYTSMDAFTTDLTKMGLPHNRDNPVTIQQIVSNMTVFAGGGAETRVTTGTGIQTGNVEFWPSNYNASNGGGIPNASAAVYDFGDGGFSEIAGYGSFQIHNHGAQEVLLAYNRWGSPGNPDDLGIGNNTGSANLDYTFMSNSGNYTAKRLAILVQVLPLYAPAGLQVLMVDDREVSLAWQARTGATGYVLRRNGQVLTNLTTTNFVDVHDLPATEFTYDIAAVFTNLTSTFSPAVVVTSTFDNVYTFVPEAAGYEVVYHLNLPIDGNYRNPNIIPYGIDRSAEVEGMRRVAYYLELDGAEHEWVFVSMDAFTRNPSHLALPHHALGYNLKRNLNNLDVIAGGAAIGKVVTGTGITTGNIEAWPNNYGGENLGGVPNANNSFDVGDYITYPSPIGYSCFQIHNHGVPEAILACNRWGSGGVDDVGIGNFPGSANTDWTFSLTATNYTLRSFGVLVQPFTVPPAGVPTGLQVVTSGFSRVVLSWNAVAEAEAYQLIRDGVVVAEVMDSTYTDTGLLPDQSYTYRVTAFNPLGTTARSAPVFAQTSGELPVYTNVAEAASFEVIYALELPDDADYRYHTLPEYLVDRSSQNIGAFDRVAYYLELDDEWVWVSMDAFTSDLTKIGVPHYASTAFFRQTVDNLNVLAGGGAEMRVTNGVGITTGNIEFWPNSYGNENSAAIPNASNLNHDWGDDPTGSPGYSSLQVHNHGATVPHTILAYNHWGSAGLDDLGIGSQPTGDPDWTFANNADSFASKRLFVLVQQVNDLDRDGLPDDAELQYFGNLGQLPQGDPDNDGLTTRQELEAGTNPNDANSAVMLEVLRTPTGERLLRFDSVLQHTYRVEYRDFLTVPVWTPMGPAIPGTGNPIELLDAGIEESAVYRLRVNP
jgi:hypothetical protein